MKKLTFAEKVKNIIGSILGYGACDCGRNWWWVPETNPGIRTSLSGGRILCDYCYEERKEEVDKNNKRISQIESNITIYKEHTSYKGQELTAENSQELTGIPIN